MQAEIAVRALLLQASAVTSHVGDRVFPALVPQGADLPALVTHHVSTVPGPLLSPALGVAPSHERTRLSVHAVAPTYSACQHLLAAIRTALHGYRGTAAGVRVGHIGADLVGPALRDDELSIYSQSIDLVVITLSP